MTDTKEINDSIRQRTTLFTGCLLGETHVRADLEVWKYGVCGGGGSIVARRTHALTWSWEYEHGSMNMVYAYRRVYMLVA